MFRHSYYAMCKSQIFFFVGLAWATILVEAPKIDELRASVTSEEQKAYIKVNVILETSPEVVSCNLTIALPETHLSEATVYRWYGD